MCFGGGDNSAAREAAAAREATERQERERQERILAGQTNIDKAFGQFDDSYFDGFRTSYTDNYQPRLDRQYAEAKDRMIAALAGRGQINSTVGASRIADLDERFREERTNIANRGLDATNDLRAKVENQKSNLYGLNQSTADPLSIGTQARAASTALVAPQSYSPLGDVFASALQPVAAYVSADRNSVNPQLAINKQPVVYRSPTSSGRVV